MHNIKETVSFLKLAGLLQDSLTVSIEIFCKGERTGHFCVEMSGDGVWLDDVSSANEALRVASLDRDQHYLIALVDTVSMKCLIAYDSRNGAFALRSLTI